MKCEAQPPADIPRYYVQAGSTLRNVGRPRDALTLLREGQRQFPDDRAIAAFSALASWSAGDPRAAVQALLLGLVATGDATVARYARAITAYAKELD